MSLKPKSQETNHVLEYIRNEIGIDHFYVREKKTILCRIDEETLGILDEMEQPSSVSDNKSRLGGPGSIGAGPNDSLKIDGGKDTGGGGGVAKNYGQNAMQRIRNIVQNESDTS